MKPQKVSITMPKTKTTFEEIQERGTSKYNWLWFKANRAAVGAANTFGLDYTDPTVRLFLTYLVERVLGEAITAPDNPPPTSPSPVETDNAS